MKSSEAQKCAQKWIIIGREDDILVEMRTEGAKQVHYESQAVHLLRRERLAD